MVSIRSDLAESRIAPLFKWLALLFCVAASAARAADLSELVDRWCAAQTNIQTWTADLTQTRTLKVLSQPLVTRGKVWAALPNRSAGNWSSPRRPSPCASPTN